MTHKHYALVVDDQVAALDALKPILRSLRHDYDHARTQVEAEAKLEQRRYCYVLLDLEFPADDDCVGRVETGFNFLADLRTRYGREELPVIITTAHERGAEYPIRALQLNANDFARKSFDDDTEPLDVKIRRVLAQTCELRRQQEALRQVEQEARPATFNADHSFHFHGECRKRRYRMTIDGEVVHVRLGTFTILWKLAAAGINGSAGWVAGRELNAGNYNNAISRMRRDLEQAAGVHEACVEGDGHGMYRLSVPPERVSFNEAPMRVHHPGLLELLPRERASVATPRKRSRQAAIVS